MGRFIDLTGKKIGDWLILRRGHNNKHGQIQWLCQCECGKQALVNGNNLLQGRSKKCITCAGSALKYTGIFPGQKFGKWTILNKAEKTKNYQTQWLCQCECGEKRLIISGSLCTRHTKGCKKCSKNAFKDLIEQKFGKWTVLERAPNKNSQSQWLCKCECGTISEVSGSSLRQKKTTQCKKCAGTAPKDSLNLVGKTFKNINEFIGAVIGTLLGDASISKPKTSKTYSLHFGHSAKQRQYALHKKALFSSLTLVRDYTGIQHGKYEQIKCNSRAHPLYSTLREEFYLQENGKKTRKVVSAKIMNNLTIHGLALWYQDDGHLKFHNGFGCPLLCTDNFTKLESELMAKCLFEKFGLGWTVIKHCNKYYLLRLRYRFKNIFFEMIAPFIHKSMTYKINPEGKQAIKGCVEIVNNTCLHCKKNFTVPIWYGVHKYCCTKCYHNSRKGGLINSVELICQYCGKKFIVPRCRKNLGKYCDLNCYKSRKLLVSHDDFAHEKSDKKKQTD